MFFLKDLYNNFKKLKRLTSIKLCSFILFVSKRQIDKDNIISLLNSLNMDELSIYIDDIITFAKNNFDNITINDVYEYHLNNDTYLESIEYYDYFSNNKLLEWIKNKYNFISCNTLFCNYRFTNIIFDSAYNIYHDEIISLVKMNDTINQNNHTIDILKTDINKNFDTIFGMLPNKVTNIIHAQCCKKIKDLKIRGTKSEPLYLQYLMKSLNQNGNAIIIVPNNLLYNDSKQHVDTRRYLLDNFNLKEIIQLSSDFFYKKNQKYSLLYFTNSGKTDTIDYYKLNTQYDIEKLIVLEYDNIINNNNVLLFNYYNNKTHLVTNINTNIVNIKLNQVFDITNKPTHDAIKISKTYKNDSSISLYCKESSDNDAYYLVNKSNHNTEYLNIIVLNNLKYTMNKLLKNNSNQYDIIEIGNMMVPIVEKETQQKIISYYKFKRLLIDTNNEQINKFIEMQNNFIQINIDLYNTKTICIEDICDIYSSSNITNKELQYIGIIKNSSIVGNIYIVNNQDFNNNSYYLSIKSSKINQYTIDYIYIWLKYNNKVLFDIAHNNTQKILSKNNINKFIVKNINYNLQETITTYYKKYNEMINKLQDTNESLYSCNNIF